MDPIPESTFILEPKPQSLDEILSNNAAELSAIEEYRRAANYIAAAQIFLKDNVLLEEPLQHDHIKDRLLGHWGTCPGINLVYAHCNALIKRYNLSMMLVTGPGHGAPANIANLYLEGTMGEFFPECSLTHEGLHMLIKAFSWPRGFASHLTAHIPGSIHEGGELGYCLSVAFGSVFDNPDLITTCIIGDGEAETGPLSTSWNSIKYLNPVTSGAVIPILHLNEYKISSPTIYGSMSDQELRCHFTGLGYQVFVVDNMAQADAEMYRALDWAYQSIKSIQNKARTGGSKDGDLPPRWPMIVMRTLKGWTGIKELHGKPIEGTWRSHQVPAPNAKADKEELEKVEQWLRSYNPRELFPNQKPNERILISTPKGDQRMGTNPVWRGKGKKSTILKDVVDVLKLSDTGIGGGGSRLSLDGNMSYDADSCGTVAGDAWDPLALPDLKEVEVDVTKEGELGRVMVSPMKVLGKYLAKLIEKNPKTFRIFSPDELSSNKLDGVLEVSLRQFEGKVRPEATSQVNKEGRVLEMLSEHTLQGWLQGYLLTGRQGVFPSYEAFLGIVGTMMDQYSKFIKMAMEVDWRPAVPSLNYIASSTLWRQEHNGFSHQNPGFINTLLNKKSAINRIYFPPDGNCMVFVMNSCLASRNKINLIYGAKHETPQWLSRKQAAEHCTNGASIWKWASTDDGVNPDVVLVSLGVEPTIEVMGAAHLLKRDLPGLRVRVVNVVDLMVFLNSDEHPHGWGETHFDAVFTPDRPIIINFHGYPSAVKQLLFNRAHTIKAGDKQIPRFSVHGYIEEGTTTTPFDMAVSNQTSRFHIALEALKLGGRFNPDITVAAIEAGSKYVRCLKEFSSYIVQTGNDPVEASKYWEDFKYGTEKQSQLKKDAVDVATGAKKMFDAVGDMVAKAVQTK